MHEPERLEALIDQNAAALLRAAVAFLGSYAEAEDAVQDTFLKYLEKTPDFRGEAQTRAWLMKVLANDCRSRLRRRKRHGETALTEDLPAPDPESGAVWQAVRTLPAAQRACVHLHYYEGYRTEEIAAILRERPGTVRSQLSRARQALREILKEEL